jgi:NAD(P)H-hydrate epimerase
MENAGRACAEAAFRMLEDQPGRRAMAFCGKGNNGGDGFVMARHLSNRGCEVEVFLLGTLDAVREGGGEAATNLQIILKMEIPVHELSEDVQVGPALESASDSSLLIDALFGTGLSGEVRGRYRPLIEGMNESGLPIFSVDVPSGLDCDTGQPLGVAVRAARSVTFVLPKRCHAIPGTEQYTGPVEVADISVPRGLIERKVAEWKAQEA